MKANVQWIDGLSFNGSTPEHSLKLDAKAPLGKGSGLTPKELVALGMAGCTAMDVVSLLRKYRQPPDAFDVSIEVTPTKGHHPIVFEKAAILYSAKGIIDPEKLMEAVTLSQTEYCGVNAMLSKALPISYRVELNGKEIGSGEAKFNF